MVGLRRFGPLITAVLVGYGVIGARLYEVQVEEHEAWSREARNLVRAATFVPHKRGRILDRRGRELVHDEELYELDFTWRDFRRGHPLGQVVQVRSLLELRPVPLTEALQHLEDRVLEAVRLAPAAIEAFGRGDALVLGEQVFPACDDPAEEQRWTRRAHLHFYVKGLLGVSRAEARALAAERGGPPGRRPYAERVAELRGVQPAVLESELVEQLGRRRRELERLAGLIEEGEDGADDPGEGTALDRLVQRLERIRTGVEDDSADDLFARAHGFGAWRLERANLARLDLDWLARSLFWDRPRLEAWIESRGSSWEQSLDTLFAGPTIARAKVETGADPGRRVLNALADAFADPGDREGVARAIPRDWRRVEDLAVLAQAERWVGGAAAREELGAALPVTHPELRESRLEPRAELERALALFERMGAGGASSRGGPPSSGGPLDSGIEAQARALAGRLVAVAQERSPTYQPGDLELYSGVLAAWNDLLQERIAVLLDEVASREGRVRLAEEWIESALEERAYVVRDRGSRPRRLRSEPGDDLVQLVTRFPREYAGFGVRATTRRVAVELESEGSDQPLAHLLLGRVRTPYLTTLLEQYALKLELERLQQKRVQSEEDAPRIEAIVSEVYLPGEFQGGSGLEAYFDGLLRGQNGYRETRGLQDKRDGGREPLDLAPVDGLDLGLTLDVDLQRAAQHVLAHPAPVPAGEDKPDRVWWEHPVGALVLITPEGDVLAAASTPLEPGRPGPHQDEERAVARERTLTQPTFHPPGSVFKPFVAAWALDREGLDPLAETVPCGSPARYGAVRCWNVYGHGPRVALHAALEGSCNCYFAWLGERLSGTALRELAREFGFGEPTGVRVFGSDDGRVGLDESHGWGLDLDSGRSLGETERQRLGNGLSHVTVTPMQVARAYAGLATGVLPTLRLLDSVRSGGEVLRRVPYEGRPLDLSRASLEEVRASLVDVVRSGTAARRGLDPGNLGFVVAAKTGSADYKQKGLVPADPDAPLSRYEFVPGVRKHAWFAGWFPAHAPRAVLVVYVHDTSTTSSHSAVHLARQFLEGEALQRWFAEQEGAR